MSLRRYLMVPLINSTESGHRRVAIEGNVSGEVNVAPIETHKEIVTKCNAVLVILLALITSYTCNFVTRVQSKRSLCYVSLFL